MLILFDSIEDFHTWNNQMNNLLGYPNASKTETYSSPITSNKTNKVLAYANDDCDVSNLMVITYHEAENLGFFPPRII